MFVKPSTGNNKIFILTGEPGSGKSSFLDNLVEILLSDGLLLAGFTAPSFQGESSTRLYSLKDIQTGQSMLLASESPEDGWLPAGKFSFNQGALQRGNHILMDEDICRNDLAIIDEIGHFELEGKIWAEAISELNRKNCIPMLWSVRNSLIDRVIQNWNLTEPVIFKIEEQSPEEAAKIILLYSQA